MKHILLYKIMAKGKTTREWIKDKKHKGGIKNYARGKKTQSNTQKIR